MDLSTAHMDDLKTVMEDWKNELLVYKFALDELDTKFSIISQEYNLIHGHNRSSIQNHA